MRKAKKAGIITGLPDAYGRGRIIGDYRRVALYGVDRLIAEKEKEMASLERDYIDYETVRDREEISEQIKSLKQLKEMALSYGFDISGPAKDAREAFQWLYFAYLAAVKEQNGAAMSIGRISTFLDIYIERDLKEGKLTEELAQELVDQLVIKLRIVRFLRTPEYEKLFSGDPTWVPKVSEVWRWMEERWLQNLRSGFCTLFSTWDMHRSPTLQYFGPSIFPKALKSTVQRYQFIQAPSSMKATT